MRSKSLTAAFMLASLVGPVAAAAQVTMTRPIGGDSGPVAIDPNMVLLHPDVVVRGRSSTITLQSGDPAGLKQVQVSPPDGVRVLEIKEVAATPGKMGGVTLTLQVDANAVPGDRALTIPATITIDSTARGSDDPKLREIEKQMRDMIQERAGRAEVASIHINSHEVRIADVAIMPAARPGGNPRIVVTIQDQAGDFAVEAAPPPTSGALQLIPVPVQMEAVCATTGNDFVLVSPDRVDRKDASTVVITGEVHDAPRGDCELRTRVEDQAGNLSEWSVKMIRLP